VSALRRSAGTRQFISQRVASKYSTTRPSGFRTVAFLPLLTVRGPARNLGPVFGEPRNERGERIDVEDRLDVFDAREAFQGSGEEKKAADFGGVDRRFRDMDPALAA
jgi:hypothetical protein